MASINKLLFITSTIKSTHHQKAKTYEWRFGKIHYTKCGKGTPLLLIHDVIPGSSDYEWQENANFKVFVRFVGTFPV